MERTGHKLAGKYGGLSFIADVQGGCVYAELIHISDVSVLPCHSDAVHVAEIPAAVQAAFISPEQFTFYNKWYAHVCLLALRSLAKGGPAPIRCALGI